MRFFVVILFFWGSFAWGCALETAGADESLRKVTYEDLTLLHCEGKDALVATLEARGVDHFHALTIANVLEVLSPVNRVRLLDQRDLMESDR